MIPVGRAAADRMVVAVMGVLLAVLAMHALGAVAQLALTFVHFRVLYGLRLTFAAHVLGSPVRDSLHRMMTSRRHKLVDGAGGGHLDGNRVPGGSR